MCGCIYFFENFRKLILFLNIDENIGLKVFGRRS